MIDKTNFFRRCFGVTLYIFLMFVMPWDELTGGFVDRLNYENYFIFEDSVLTYQSFDRFFDYLTGEYLWHYTIGYLISDLGYSTDEIFGLISFLFLIGIALYVVRYIGLVALVFIFSPIVVDLAFSQLRLAAALSIVILASLTKNRILLIFAYGVSLFIHTSMVLFGLSFFVAYFVSKNFEINYKKKYFNFDSFFLFINNKYSKIIILAILGFLISLTISPLRAELLSVVGDRRVDYHDMSSSFGYSIFWICLLFVFLIQPLSWYSRWSNNYSIIILFVVFFNLFFSGYSLRFIAASLPIFVQSIFSIERYKFVLASFYFVYLSLQWLYWLKLHEGLGL